MIRHSLSLLAAISTKYNERIVDPDLVICFTKLIDLLKTWNSNKGCVARLLLNISEVNEVCRELFLIDGLPSFIDIFYVDILNNHVPQLCKIMSNSTLELLKNSLIVIFHESRHITANVIHRDLTIMNYILCGRSSVHHIYQALAEINFISILLRIRDNYPSHYSIPLQCNTLLRHLFLGKSCLLPCTSETRSALASFVLDRNDDNENVRIVRDCLARVDQDC